MKCEVVACTSGLEALYNPVYRFRVGTELPYEMVLGLKICDSCRTAVAEDLLSHMTPQIFQIATIMMHREPTREHTEVGWSPISEHATIFKKPGGN